MQINGSAVAAGVHLAPFLLAPSTMLDNGTNNKTITFDPSGALTEGLGLSGKWQVSALALFGLPTGEISTVKLTIDGVVIWNDTGTKTHAGFYFNHAGNTLTVRAAFIVNTDFSLEVQTVADSAVQVIYHAHPLL